MLLALTKELQLRKYELKSNVVETIYFGGGTPSVLSAAELQQLIDEVNKNYSINNNPEITIEANPDDLNAEQIEQLSKTSINRLSIGIQSFFEDDLKAMNRAHNATEAKQCLEAATKYFNNITIDLIYGFPNMSVARWKENLAIAFSFNVPHISSYALTVEPKTALESFIKQGKYPNVDDALAHEHFEVLIEETQKQGFVQYEISNFGKEGCFSKHNTSYWKGKKYLGIGPSAHSYNGNQRSWNVVNNTKYIKSLLENKLPSEVETLSKNDAFNEYVMTGLRTIWGVNLNTVKVDFGANFKEYLLKASEKYINEQLLYLSDNKLLVTQQGKFLCDGIASQLFKID